MRSEGYGSWVCLCVCVSIPNISLIECFIVSKVHVWYSRMRYICTKRRGFCTLVLFICHVFVCLGLVFMILVTGLYHTCTCPCSWVAFLRMHVCTSLAGVLYTCNSACIMYIHMYLYMYIIHAMFKRVKVAGVQAHSVDDVYTTHSFTLT